MSESPVLILPYGDFPSRWGISVERQPWGFRLIVPPVSRWYLLPKSYLGILVPIYCVCASGFAWLKGAQLADIAGVLITYGVVLAVIVGSAIRRLSMRTVIDVTHDEFSIATVNSRGRGSRRCYPVDAVGEVKTTAGHESLFIRVPGKDIIEHFVSSNRDVTVWVAEQSNQALASAKNFDLRAGEAFVPLSKDPQSGKVIVAILCALPFFALSLSSIWSDTGILGALMALILGGAIYFGITQGTQDKEYYA